MGFLKRSSFWSYCTLSIPLYQPWRFEPMYHTSIITLFKKKLIFDPQQSTKNVLTSKTPIASLYTSPQLLMVVSLECWWMWTAAAFEKLPWYLSNRYLRFKFRKKFQQTDSFLSNVCSCIPSSVLENAGFAETIIVLHTPIPSEAPRLCLSGSYFHQLTHCEISFRFMARVCWIIDVLKSLQPRCLHQAQKSRGRIISVEKKFFPGDVKGKSGENSIFVNRFFSIFSRCQLFSANSPPEQ